MTKSPKLASGVFAAALTPLTADLSPDVARLAGHCRWLLDHGCDGLAVLGTTGEANSFSVDERLAILEGLAEAGIPGRALMPGTGCCAVPDTVRLTRRAVELGAAGVLVLPPFYYKNVSDDGLFAAYSEVIERVGDTRLKVYLYHFPQMSAVPIGYGLIERLLDRYPDTVAGMKDSSGDLDNMTGAARAFPGFAVFSGSEELFLPLLRAGGAGCITAVNNVASPLAARVYAGWREGNDIEADNGLLVAVRQAIVRYPLSAALKEIMARLTGDGDWRRVRPPLRPMEDGDAEALAGALDDIGYTPPPPP
ncbi:MAG: dihydrodipicolinate synthase family protein [Proteobacteria bacterium]|nr:dihydrodipicolinate synthase family protein [Pseudomonadota bacterium]